MYSEENDMNERDIQRILPDWTLSYTISEKENEKLYMAEKTSGDTTKYSAIRAIWIPGNGTDADSLKEKPGDEGYRRYVSGLVKKQKQDFNFLRGFCSKPGIVNLREIYDISNSDDTAYLLVARYDFIQPLKEYIRDNGLTVGAAVKLGIDVCRGLEQLKKLDYKHLNLTPECIFFDGKGKFRIDGIDTDAIEKTRVLDKNDSRQMAFYPPELDFGKYVSYNVDTYSLGLILYTLLNDGKLPFEKEMGFDGAVKHRLSGAKIPSPSYNAGKLNDIILKSCSFDPKKRYGTPYMMRQELEEVYNKLAEQIKANQN